MKNTHRIKRISDGSLVGRSMKEVMRKIRKKELKEGKYALINRHQEEIAVFDLERVANGNYKGTKGKTKGHGARSQRRKRSGVKYKIVNKLHKAVKKAA